MTALRDIAWAKLNLTLEVLGRRSDGFHELESLVAFAGLGDTVELELQGALALVVEGPFASALGGDNLIIKAADAAKSLEPSLKLGRFRLVKVLPVAAGLGGGSADAAAALRLIERANGRVPGHKALAELAMGIGSDVNVCLRSEPALITGRGETVTEVRGFPPCGVVLANPGLPLATAGVYAALQASPLSGPPPRPPAPPDFAGDLERLMEYVGPRANALEAAAASLAPEIANVLAALRALDGARFARLSGSGPTCFALFATPRGAHRAATMLAESHPNWWIAASSLGDPKAEA
jgi:4-diphosphocytidyl-2-C-methyl-D-erythritol kinase